MVSFWNEQTEFSLNSPSGSHSKQATIKSNMKPSQQACCWQRNGELVNCWQRVIHYVWQGKCLENIKLNTRTWHLFLPVDSIAFVLLTMVTRPILSAFVRAFFWSNTLNLQRQRGALEAVRTPTLKSILGQRNRNVCISPSLKNCL